MCKYIISDKSESKTHRTIEKKKENKYENILNYMFEFIINVKVIYFRYLIKS